DLDVVVILFEERGDTRQADWVHFEDRRRWHGVGDQAEKRPARAEVVQGGRVEQDEIASKRIPHHWLALHLPCLDCCLVGWRDSDAAPRSRVAVAGNPALG